MPCSTVYVKRVRGKEIIIKNLVNGARRGSLWWCAQQDIDERVTAAAEMLRHHSSRWNVEPTRKTEMNHDF